MIKFGTGGWRAIIGEEFCRDNVELVAAALARKMLNERANGNQRNTSGKVVIGFDRRFLSEEAAVWVACTLAGMGIPSQFIHRANPTPLTMFHVERSQAPYGMAITASHNPAVYNGIKIFSEGGRDADLELTQELERLAQKILDEGQTIPSMSYEEALKEGLIEIIRPLNDYLDSILSTLDQKAIRNSDLRLVFDPMFGVGETPMLTLLYTLRCDVELIHGQRDPLFGGRMPAPTESTMAHLQNRVLEGGYDLGLATDGDADRLGVIDERGNFIHFNKVLVLLYHYLLKYKGWRGPVVRNLATTHMLDRVAEAFGEVCYEVPVGFKHISEKMAETGAILGGESSGGLTVVGHIHGKDGIYSGALLVEMLAVSGKKLSELWNELQDLYGKRDMIEREYHFSAAKRAEITQTLFKDKILPDFDRPIREISYRDGLKIYFEDDSWLIIRFSGTEDLLRIFCEMPTIYEAMSMTRICEEALGL